MRAKHVPELLVVAVAIAAALCSTSWAIRIKVDWDPGMYVAWNELIVDGTLAELREVGPSQFEGIQGYLFRGQAGAVVVATVVYKPRGLFVSAGDTIHFRLRTSSASEPDKHGLVMHREDPWLPIGMPRGTRGYFGFRILPDSSFAPGYEFYLEGDRQREVRKFLAALAADSASIVEALSRRRPGLEFHFTGVQPDRAAVR